MADGVNININKATLNATSLEGVGLTPLGDEKKKLFKKDDQSELMKALAEMPEAFRTVLKQTMESTGQNLLKEFFNENTDSIPDEPKEDFAKPTDKINDVKKLAAKYGTPALFLGSKIDDIIEILRNPIKETVETTRNSPISAASVIVLGSNIEDSKKYIQDFQELTDFIANQKSIDIGVFKDTQKKLDELSTSMQKSTRQKVDDKGAEKFTKKMGNITAGFGSIVKQVIALNILTKKIDFKKANQRLNDLDDYLQRLGSMGSNLATFTGGVIAASTGAFKIILFSPIFKLATKKIQSIKGFITDGIIPLLDSLDNLGGDILKKTKKFNESFKNILNIASSLLKTSLIFSAITPVALLGTLGIKVSNLFINALSGFISLINNRLDVKEIRKSVKAIASTILLTTLTAASMVAASLIVPIALKAVLGGIAIGLFAVEMGLALKILNSLTTDIIKGIGASILIGVFAGIAFVSLKLLSMITPSMTGNALVAVLGFMGVMAAAVLLGAVATAVLVPLALGVAAAALTAIFAASSYLALKALDMIKSESISHAINIISGVDGPGLIELYKSFIPLTLTAPLALAALTVAMPASALMAVFSVLTKKSIDALSSIETDSIELATMNIKAMASPLKATAVLAPAAILAMASLPPVIVAMSLLSFAAIPFKSLVNAFGKEPLFEEDDPRKAKSGILGFVNVMTLTMGLLGLTALIAPLAVFGATALSAIMLVLVPALTIFSKISKFFSKRADPNLVDVIYGDNLEKPLKSKYGLIAFLNGAVLAAKTVCGGTIHFLLGSISAVLMGLFFSSIKKSLDAMDQLAEAAKNGVDNEAIQSYLETMEQVAKSASSPGLLASLGEAVNSWVADKLGTSTADLINQMTQSVGPMRQLSNQLQGINLEGISIFLDAMNKLQGMQKAPNIKAIRGTIDGLNEIAESMNIDGEKFNANINAIMPGVERLQNLPEGSGLTKKAKEIKSAINTIFSANTGKDADNLINKVDRLTASLERLSKIDSNNIAKTLGTSGGISYKEASSSTLGVESSKKNSSTNVNIDNSSLETLLEKILIAIEDLKQTKTWADEPTYAMQPSR